MNVGLVTPYFTDHKTFNSGLANHFDALSRGLYEQGHTIVVIHIRPQYEDETDTCQQQIVKPGFTVLTYKATLKSWQKKLCKGRWTLTDFFFRLNCMFIAASQLGKIIKTYQIQIIETSSFFSLCYMYMAFKPKVPLVIRVSTTFLQIMDNYYPFRSRLYRLIARIEIKMIKKARHLITHAHEHAEVISNLYGLNVGHLHIIPHGIRPPLSQRPTTKRPSGLKVLYVGRFEYRKGIDTLLQAIPLALQKIPGLTFEIIGEDPDKQYEEDFKATVSEDIISRVNFRGPVGNLETCMAYADCDFFVAPSRYESFGLIYIEAMSYGKPVIGCRVGGVPEIITEYETGLFAKPDDPEHLAGRIILLCQDEALRIRMGNNAKINFEKKFTDKILASRSADYYREVISSINQ